MSLSAPVNPILLGVNVDHCATIRQARYPGNPKVVQAEPNLLQFALLCESAGADGITMHLREDRRHVQAFDVEAVRVAIKTRLNLEMACTKEMMEYALQIAPESVCLVPEKREEITTEGGLDLIKHFDRVKEVVRAMEGAGIATSLFIDPEENQIRAAAELAAPWIELHTGAFSNKFATGEWQAEWDALIQSADLAHSLGLVVNAGHGINYENITQVKTLPHLNELNIGHSIISRALFEGVESAVQRMLCALHN
ncbi:MAG: pyridoxine 5'-phosphate synthase [Puniceicoccaceae bacterium]|nr:pyridoxine 5'-phosphate synthase [Puniceicoccaceae bacterium]|tara:strand:- start:276 stop:1037 length:762 start_codon:yes stop_codon:yes gene_type:complete